MLDDIQACYAVRCSRKIQHHQFFFGGRSRRPSLSSVSVCDCSCEKDSTSLVPMVWWIHQIGKTLRKTTLFSNILEEKEKPPVRGCIIELKLEGMVGFAIDLQ